MARQQLESMERLKKKMLLFYIDLDNLKSINDILGHKEGDRAISEAAAVLKEAFRKSDIIGRIGGDEFVVLAMNTSDEICNILTNRLQKILSTKKIENFTLSLSKGIAHYDPENPLTFDELLMQADRLMYEEKNKKNTGTKR